MNTHFRNSLVLAAAAAVTACASSPRLPDANTLQINAILDQTGPSDGVEWATERCLSTHKYRSVEIIDERRLLFKGRNGKVWVNEFRTPCRSIRRNDTLMFELRSSSTCAADQVTVIDTILGQTASGPTCTLGEFRPLPAEQAAALQEVLRKR